MMISPSHLLSMLAMAILLFSVVDMLRRGKLRERHAVWWLLLAILGLVFTVFPSLLTGLASAIGVGIPLNLAFFAAIIVLFLVNVQHSKELTLLEERTRALAEQSALLEQRIIELESISGNDSPV